MAVAVTGVFLRKIFLQRGGEIDAGLIGDTDQHPKYISQLIRELTTLVRILKRLIAVEPAHETRDLAHFFSEYRHVRQFAEVADTYRADPLVDLLLRLGDR